MARPNVEGLRPDVRLALAKLEARLREEGIPYTLTSAHRSTEEQARLYARYKAGDPSIPLAAPPGRSRHEKGESVDLHTPKQHRQRLNAIAGELGFAWLGTKDPVHYDFGGQSQPAAKPVPAGLAAFRAASGSRAQSSVPAGLAAFRAASKTQAADAGVPTGLSAFRAASPSAPSPASGVPAGLAAFRAASSGGEAPKPAATAPKPSLVQWAGSLSNAYQGYLNQLAREGRQVPSVINDPAAHFAALPGALQRAFAEGARNFGPTAVPPEHLRIAFGAEKGKTGRAAYNTLAVLDYASSIATDPTNLVAGPVSKVVGKALSPVTRIAERALEGGQAQAAAMKATRARETAETAYRSARANNAGSQALAKLGQEVGIAQAAERQAVAGAQGLAQGSRAARLGVATAKTKPVTLTLKAEQAAGAHLRQEATKLTAGWLALVGAQKGAFLSRPATIASNTIGNVAAAEGELARHGLNLARLAPHSKRAKQELDAFRAGQLVGDVAELEQHAPGVLGTMVQQTMGAKTSKNPLLEAQSYVDQMMKVSVYKALKAKLGPAAAAQRVKTALFDYSDRPAMLQLADKYGLAIFTGFPVAATKSFVDTLVRRPDLIARYPRLQQQLLQEFPGSAEAYEKLRPYQKGPFTYPTGKDTFIDLNRFHPFGQALGIVQEGQRLVQEGFAPRPPEDRALLEGTVLSPTANARRKATEGANAGAPGAEQWRTYFREELLGRVPAVKDAMRIRDAWVGAGPSHSKTAEPQSKTAAAAQSLLGVATVRGEAGPEKQTRLAPKIDARGKTGSGLVAKLEAELQSGKAKNGFASEAASIKSFDDAKREYNAARRYLRTMLTSPQNIDGNGKLLPGGQRRIRDALFRAKALGNRLGALGGQLD